MMIICFPHTFSCLSFNYRLFRNTNDVSDWSSLRCTTMKTRNVRKPLQAMAQDATSRRTRKHRHSLSLRGSKHNPHTVSYWWVVKFYYNCLFVNIRFKLYTHILLTSDFGHNLMNCLLYMHRYESDQLKAIREREHALVPPPVCSTYERPDKDEAIATFEGWNLMD